jgi:hypothetical protein
MLKPLLLRLSIKGTIGLQSFVILVIFQDLVIGAKILLENNAFQPSLYNLSSLNFPFSK